MDRALAHEGHGLVAVSECLDECANLEILNGNGTGVAQNAGAGGKANGFGIQVIDTVRDSVKRSLASNTLGLATMASICSSVRIRRSIVSTSFLHFCYADSYVPLMAIVQPLDQVKGFAEVIGVAVVEPYKGVILEVCPKYSVFAIP